MNSDGELLQTFADRNDEACFAQVVQRHIGFVYAVSLRRLRDAHAAQDATQAVFIALARKARSVAQAPSVTGWLHRSACYETRNLMRSQANRRARETEAAWRGMIAAEVPPNLEALGGVLDDVLGELSDADRHAILARFFSEQSYAQIGAALRINENSARMRVDRALAKLRDRLERRGVTSTTAALAGALPAYASAAVPTGLASAVTKASIIACAGGAGAVTFLSFMSTAKVITGIAVMTALGSVFYAQRQTKELGASMADARAEATAARQQLHRIEREVADLRQRSEAAAAPAPTAHSAVAAPAGATVAEAMAPVPGVTPKPPKGWFKNGNATDRYEVGVDENTTWGGMASAYAKSIGAAEGKFGGMMQTIAADAYKEQRIRVSGWVKTEDANDGGGHLWARVDGPETRTTGRSLQFDNMDQRAPKGTTDWQEYSIVLDVPANATQLNYGFFVQGNGKMWVNGLTITPVGTDVPTTNLLKPAAPLPAAPVNLGFAAPPKSP